MPPEIFWHLYPLGFLGAEPTALPAGADPVPRLRGLLPWLDYLTDLGCTGLLLGPVFESGTHGYDTLDHFRVDRRLGTEEDLVALVRAAGERGVGVVLDGVFNHVGRDFPRRELLRADGRVFEGHDALVELDHAAPPVVDYVAGVLAYWLERGIAGWRLDVAYKVPVPFWREVTGRVRSKYPAAWLVGEVIHGDYGRFVTEGGLDSVTQYELWKAIWSSLNDRNLFELRWSLQRHNARLELFAPQTFVGNHDVTRLASRLLDERHIAVALVILFTVGGVPSVYAGDEQAFRGVKEERAGGDDAVRPAFPPDPSGLAASGWPWYRLHQDLIGLRRARPWLVRAATVVHTVTNTTLGYLTGDALAVALNIGDEPAAVAWPAGNWSVVAGGPVVEGRLSGPGWAVAERVG